jgi:3-oxoadipate enol-lactonase
VRTVVLSGSLGSTRAMWDAQLRLLDERFRVIRVDHPGHGGVPVTDFHDVGDLARHVLERVDEPQFSFVGLSLGGAIGMWLALHEPERLDRLVLACTSARFAEPQFWHERAATVRADGIEAIADVVVERWFTPGFPEVQRYREMLLSTDPEGYARCCEALAQWDARGELANVTAPTLAIAGADDPSTPPEQLQSIAAAIPGARLETIPNARHLPNIERAAEFNALLADFL